MQIANILSNYNSKDKVNFKGSYKVNPADIKDLPFELYNYLRKGGEADTFIKSLDKSIKALVIKDEQTLLCDISSGHDIQSTVELDVEDVDIVKNILKESGQLIERLIKINKPIKELDEATKEKILKISRLN